MDFEYTPTEDKALDIQKPSHIIKLITLGDDSECIKELINKYIDRKNNIDDINVQNYIDMDS